MKTSSNPSAIMVVIMFSVALLVIAGCACLSVGIFSLIKDPWNFPGIASIVGSIAIFAWVVALYKYFQYLDNKDKPGKTIDDIKK